MIGELPRYRSAGFGAMVPSDTGTWVRFDDVQELVVKVMADLRDALDALAVSEPLPPFLAYVADRQKEGRG